MSTPTTLTDEGLVLERPHPLARERASMSAELLYSLERNNPVPFGWRPSLQRLYRFGNYGLSVVYDPMLHSSDFAWEVAVIRFLTDRPIPFELVYTTPLTTDVEVFLTDEDTNAFIHKAKAYFESLTQEPR